MATGRVSSGGIGLVSSSGSDEILIIIRANWHKFTTNVQNQIVLVVHELERLHLELVRQYRLFTALLVAIDPPVGHGVFCVVKHYNVVHTLLDVSFPISAKF